MTESPLTRKLAERNEKLKLAEYNALLAKLLDMDTVNVFWNEDKESEKMEEEICSSGKVVFRAACGRDEYVIKAVEQVKAFLNLSDAEIVCVSIRLPSYIFTSWFALDGVTIFKFLNEFLHQYDVIVFLLKTEREFYLFGQAETELEVHQKSD